MPEAQAPTGQQLKEAWETYTASWKAPTRDEKLNLFNQVLDQSCHYRDPTVHTEG
jgi:hypothetical protein